MSQKTIIWWLAPLLLSGCAAMHPSPLASTQNASTLGLSTQATAPISPVWWEQLNDSALNQLIAKALQDSPDLAMAQARLRQADAGADLASSQRGIQIGLAANGVIGHQENADNRQYSPLVEALENRFLGDDGINGSYASARLQGKWSLDLWGRYRHQTEAALGKKQAVAYEIAQTKLLLAQAVAGYYRQWQLLLQQQTVIQARLQLNRERERIVQELIRAGQVAPSQLYPVLQATHKLQTAISDTNGGIAQIRHALAAVTAQPAEALDTFTPSPVSAIPAPPVAALHADLLGKRPDIAGQREALKARYHLIESAKAQFYPDISIQALAGWSQLQIGNLPHTTSLITGLLPSISLPIFSAGALEANLAQKEAEYDEQAARYNKTIYTALQEAADALTKYETASKAVAQQQQMLALGLKTTAAAKSRYQTSLDNKMAFINAQDEHWQLQGQLAQLQTQQYAAWLALNVAFGGGFSAGNAP